METTTATEVKTEPVVGVVKTRKPRATRNIPNNMKLEQFKRQFKNSVGGFDQLMTRPTDSKAVAALRLEFGAMLETMTKKVAEAADPVEVVEPVTAPSAEVKVEAPEIAVEPVCHV